MKKILIKIILFAGILCDVNSLWAQDVVIDYQAWNPTNPPCDLFGTPTNVPATINGNTGTILHQTEIGQPEYNITGKYVELACNYASSIDKRGTKYRIAYNFKTGYNYAILITSAANVNTVGYATGPYLRIDINNNAGGGSAFCTGPQSINQNLSGNPPPVQLSSTTFTEYQFSAPNLSAAQTTLEISAIPANDGGAKIIRIRKIRIVETPPPPTFTLPASVSIPCGNTDPQTFTVTNVYNSPGVTGYTWRLGVSNGWLYNGSAAPQTINTTGNTLTLTPVCGGIQHNISVTATIGGQNYNTDTCTISVTAPPLALSGAGQICSGSQTYTLSGVPCNAPVSWSASPSGIVSLSTNGNQVTVSKITDGVATLSAVVQTTCMGAITVNKTIVVGTPSASITGLSSLCPCTCCNFFSTIDIPGASYHWSISPTAGNSVSGNGSQAEVIITGPCTLSVDITTSCGIISASKQLFLKSPAQCHGGCSVPSYMISPNPAQHQITLSALPGSESNKLKGSQAYGQPASEAHTIRNIKIYLASGKLVRQQQLSRNTTRVQIDVSGLDAGIYFIEVGDGKYRETHKVVISR